jgi:hypothetical protein
MQIIGRISDEDEPKDYGRLKKSPILIAIDTSKYPHFHVHFAAHIAMTLRESSE